MNLHCLFVQGFSWMKQWNFWERWHKRQMYLGHYSGPTANYASTSSSSCILSPEVRELASGMTATKTVSNWVSLVQEHYINNMIAVQDIFLVSEASSLVVLHKRCNMRYFVSQLWLNPELQLQRNIPITYIHYTLDNCPNRIHYQVF